MQLVFIHGSGGTGKVWKYQTQYFPGAIAVDLPGHPEGDLLESVQSMAAWLKQYVDDAGLSELVLIGHSIGGGIALQYALDCPEDVHAIISIGSGGRLRVHPDTIISMEQALAKPESIEPFVKSFWQRVEPEFAAELIADGLALGPAAFLQDFKACDEFDVMESLGEIDQPMLAIVGSDDVMTPQKYAEFMVQKMPDALLEVIHDGTHAVFAEKPKEVNSAIERFLATLT
ncbi:MAG: pimeloyl-ACP methyl ester carboxylesterase [Alcanivorax sp.]|jgi:pimeloyl-ACP methyl ester carboxylesterase